MKSHYKFHAIAIAAIFLVVIVIYMLMPQPSAPVAADPALMGERYIAIYSATWGQACNPQIEQAIAERANVPVKAEKPDSDAPLALQPVSANNVLQAVSDLCNGKLTCEFTASSQTFGVEPLHACPKNLEVSYRCFAYDRLWTVTAQQGQTVTLDCNEKDKTAAPATK